MKLFGVEKKKERRGGNKNADSAWVLAWHIFRRQWMSAFQMREHGLVDHDSIESLTSTQ